MRKLTITYLKQNEDGTKETTTQLVEVPEKCPVHFFAVAQPTVTINWLEKVAMKKYIEELEEKVEELEKYMEEMETDRSEENSPAGW